MAERRSVALLIETSKTYGRGLLRGISQYVRTHRPWSIFLAERGLDDPLPPWFRRWRGDGIILRSSTLDLAAAVRRRRVPTVYLGEVPDTGLPSLHSDERTIARQAAEHLMERGFTSFGYVGLRGVVWSDQRREFFVARLAEKGHSCALCEFESRDEGRGDWVSRERELSKWLLALPKPAALLACYDVMGVRVLDACRGVDLAVPEQVAVMGVDNDALLCTLADPPLSSVPHDLERIGYRAAALLDAMMEGQSPPQEQSVVPPRGVIGRQSTDILAIPDQQVALALRFIREHACDGISVDDVVRAVGIHRVTLTRRFEKHLERSPKAEIMRLQLERVKHLLRETDFTLSHIADLAGFRHPEYMNVIFKRKVGQTPGAYRKQFGSPGG